MTVKPEGATGHGAQVRSCNPHSSEKPTVTRITCPSTTITLRHILRTCARAEQAKPTGLQCHTTLALTAPATQYGYITQEVSIQDYKTPRSHLKHSHVLRRVRVSQEIQDNNVTVSLETLHVLLHFLRHPNFRAGVSGPISRRENLHVEIHLPALVELKHGAVVQLCLEVVRVGGHQISAQVDVLEHSFQLRREGASALRLSRRRSNKNKQKQGKEQGQEELLKTAVTVT